MDADQRLTGSDLLRRLTLDFARRNAAAVSLVGREEHVEAIR